MKLYLFFILFLFCDFIAIAKDNIDSSQYAIFTFDKENPQCFNSDCNATTLNKSEIKKIFRLVEKAIGIYNRNSLPRNLKNSKVTSIVLSDYKLQFVPVKNKDGEKHVWVNCICERSAKNYEWKKNIVYVKDGGKCYFNLYVNLTKEKQYGMIVNGES